MPIQQTTPDKAKEILDQNPNAVYLDVRSIPEFVQGHAVGAINIPLMHYRGQMVPNPDFPKVVEANLQKDKPILVGCKMGGRSQKACEIMERLGYQNITNIDGGFGGHEEQPGWQDLGLPVDKDNGEGIGYESLAQKAGVSHPK
jgi:rhodanese-related sulfurtransferase